jgi:ATP-dependent helicase/nuclease subunit A
VKRYSRAEEAVPAAGPAAEPATSASIVLPSWLQTPASSEASAESLLRPSDPADDDGHPVRTGVSMMLRAKALKRGTLVHRLLQSLPDITPERRRAAALSYLARNTDGWAEDERRALAEGVLALITDPRFAHAFAPGSRAEVSIVGRLDRRGRPQAVVSGQIDRLVVREHEVLIVDYKTNYAPPKTPAEAPAGYIRQLALYRAVLARLYPQKSVRAALLWTERPELMEISAPALDAALAS